MKKSILSQPIPKLLVLLVLVAGAAILVSRWQPAESFEPIAVAMPASLSAEAQDGEILFETNCASCHGERGGGTQVGPPLIHDIYNPGHHSDEAFLLAARLGVRAHHWPFGNMPRLPQVSEAEIRAITRYVRELQVANGIGYRPHTM